MKTENVAESHQTDGYSVHVSGWGRDYLKLDRTRSPMREIMYIIARGI